MACYTDDLAGIRGQIQDADCKFDAAHAVGSACGFWFCDLDGILFQVKDRAKTQPVTKSSIPDLSIATNVCRASARYRVGWALSTHMSHMALFTSDVTRSLDFHTNALGGHLADRFAEIVSFTYGSHDSDHDLLPLLAGGELGLRYTAWDTPGVKDFGRANTQLRAAGYSDHWDPGRHVLGSNYFNYTLDGFGQWWEFSARIDYIERNADWTIANFVDKDSLYLWGSDKPAYFFVNVEQ